MASAVRQWRLLRHLVSLAVAVVTEFGFGIMPLCYTVIELYPAVLLSSLKLSHLIADSNFSH